MRCIYRILLPKVYVYLWLMASLVAQLVKNPPVMKKTPVWEDPLEKGWAPHSSIPGLPWWLAGKESTCNVRDPGLIPELGRSSGEGNRYPLQYSGLENSVDYIVHGVSKSWTWLSDFHFPAKKAHGFHWTLKAWIFFHLKEIFVILIVEKQCHALICISLLVTFLVWTFEQFYTMCFATFLCSLFCCTFPQCFQALPSLFL